MLGRCASALRRHTNGSISTALPNHPSSYVAATSISSSLSNNGFTQRNIHHVVASSLLPHHLHYRAMSTIPSPASTLSSPSFVSNIPQSIQSKVGQNLHLQVNHPINIVKRQIESYFTNNTNFAGAPFPSSSSSTSSPSSTFKTFDSMHPRVSTTAVRYSALQKVSLV
jgi:hypothetical protein